MRLRLTSGLSAKSTVGHNRSHSSRAAPLYPLRLASFRHSSQPISEHLAPGTGSKQVLIVLAARRGIATVLGTVSQYVLRNAPCPVLTVPE